MGYIRQTALVDAYIADSKEDLTLLPQSSMGSTCWVISEGLEYICNSRGKWLPRYNKTSAPLDELQNYYTKKEIDRRLEKMPAEALSHEEILAITLKKDL